jgi:hypothetical protein
MNQSLLVSDSLSVDQEVSCFLGAFAKLHKAAVSFAITVRPSVCPHGTTRLPPYGFS